MQGQYSKLLPNYCKIALFAVQFSKIFWGTIPTYTPKEAPTFDGRFVCN